MKLLENPAVPRPEVHGVGAKAGAAHVADEQSCQRDVPPPQYARAQAKVVFLPIALREHIGTERSGCVEAIPAQEQAKTDANRNVDDGVRVRAFSQTVEPVRGRL